MEPSDAALAPKRTLLSLAVSVRQRTMTLLGVPIWRYGPRVTVAAPAMPTEVHAIRKTDSSHAAPRYAVGPADAGTGLTRGVMFMRERLVLFFR